MTLAMAVAGACAQPTDEAMAAASGFTLSGTARAALATSDALLNDREPVAIASLGLRGAWRASSAVRFAADLQLGNRTQAGAAPSSVLREAYAEARSDRFDLTVGRQVLAWGRADTLNPTDYFAARDYTRLVAEDDDQRRGVDALRARWSLGWGTLQAVVEAGFRPTVIPPRHRPGILLDTRVRGDARNSWALKYDIEGGAVDGSVSYYDGRDRLPNITPLGFAGAALQVGQVYPHVRALGADVAATLGGVVVRGEFAWQQVPGGSSASPFVRHEQIYAVFGVEHNWPGELTLYAQVFGKRVLGFSDPDTLSDPRLAALARAGLAVVDQASAGRHGFSLKVTKRWSQAWSAELTVVAAWPQRDAILRPRLVYRPTDQWRWVAAGDWFRGPATSPFGQLRDNRRAPLSAELFF